MTHLYTLLVGGVVIRGGGRPDASAIAWADDTILAVGSDEEVDAISRGDSHRFDLGGAFVVPPRFGSAGSGPGTTLEAGEQADLVVWAGYPRAPSANPAVGSPPRILAEVTAGRVTAGTLPDGEGGGERQPSSG